MGIDRIGANPTAREKGFSMENGAKKTRSKASLALGILAILYVIWPLDLMAGMPFDDFIVSALALVAAYMNNARIEGGK